MGQKVNPHGLRVGVIKDWDSKWYAEGDFSDLLVEDYNIRKFLKKKLFNAGISKIEVERASERVKVTVYAAKPGVIIGKGGRAARRSKRPKLSFRSSQARRSSSTSKRLSAPIRMHSLSLRTSPSSSKSVFLSAAL